MKTILLDMDGVVVNWTKATMKLLGLDYNDPKVREALSFCEYKLEVALKEWEVTEDKIDELIHQHGYDFWYGIEKYPWSDQLVAICKSIPNTQLVACTSPGKFHAGASAKLDYLINHFGIKDYVLTRQKYLCAKPDTCLIDDLGYNIKPFVENGGRAFHWPNGALLEGNQAMIDMALLELETALRTWAE